MEKLSSSCHSVLWICTCEFSQKSEINQDSLKTSLPPLICQKYADRCSGVKMMPHDATRFLIQVHLQLETRELISPHWEIFFFCKDWKSKMCWDVLFLEPPSYNCQPVAARTTLFDTYKVECVFVSFKWLSVGFISLIRSNCDLDWQVICQTWMFHKAAHISWCRFSTFRLYPEKSLLILLALFPLLIALIFIHLAPHIQIWEWCYSLLLLAF